MTNAVSWADSRARSHSTTAGGPAVTGIDLADVARALRIMRAGVARRLVMEPGSDAARRGTASDAVLDLTEDAVEIDAALQRIDDGSYGVCHRCGHMIAVARLAVAPHARFCEPCARAR